MSKVELTLVPDYVPSWTIVDAAREFFQNAFDQEAMDAARVANWSYDADSETLTISNKATKLSIQSLLLGSTSKADNESTIGQFGEGYKVATLVFLRNGKEVVFYNNKAHEVWCPRFVKSRRFNTDVLTFFIKPTGLCGRGACEAGDEDSLVIKVSGITQQEYEEQIKPSVLQLRDDYNVVESTSLGDIIDLPGKVFVNGLFVCDYEPYTYGYNFKPGVLELDRDRKLASDFNLKWLASSMWRVSGNTDKVLELAEQGAADVAYLSECCYGGSAERWSSAALEKFIKEYGNRAVPVVNQEELDIVPAGYTGIVVSGSIYKLLQAAGLNVSTVVQDKDEESTPGLDSLQDWFDTIKDMISSRRVAQFYKIKEELRNEIMQRNS